MVSNSIMSQKNYTIDNIMSTHYSFMEYQNVIFPYVIWKLEFTEINLGVDFPTLQVAWKWKEHKTWIDIIFHCGNNQISWVHMLLTSKRI
jgi:hypothetical protein